MPTEMRWPLRWAVTHFRVTVPSSLPRSQSGRRSRDKTTVAEELQRAGVPAAPMYRAVDVLADPQITFRKVFSEMTHPLLDAPMPTETGPAPYRHIAPAELRPAPMPGEHTREICQKLLALDADETDRLIAEGVLFTHQGSS